MDPDTTDPEFWNQYPNDDKKFKEEILKGIWISVKSEDQLPKPPRKYYWEQDSGGLHMSSYMMYRLWNKDFGYMNRAE